MRPALLPLILILPWAVHQSALDLEAESFARAWVDRDARTLGESMTGEGIRLHLPGEEHRLIRPRQAQAALVSFLEKYEKGEAQVTKVSMASGGSEKAYVEIRWRTGSPGVTEPVIFTVFVAYALGEEGWSVIEIRILF